MRCSTCDCDLYFGEMGSGSTMCNSCTDKEREEAVCREREECARIAEAYVYEWKHISAGQDWIAGDPKEDIAKAIRERGLA